MSFILVGRNALPKEMRRISPKDYDYIATPGSLESDFMKNGPWTEAYPIDADHYVFKRNDGNIYEIEIAWPGSTGEELIQLVHKGGLTAEQMVLAMKLSHRFKASPHFRKTMRDIQWLRLHDVKVPDVLQPWLVKRQKETLAVHKHPVLNQPSMGFFTDNVPYVYVHDTIHLAMARAERPAYKDFQADGAEVKVSKEKWLALADWRKLDSVMEESYVLALERHQIPNNFQPDAHKSYEIALQKVCTTISSGWWREWAWEHYDDALRLYNRDYVQVFKAGVERGVVHKVSK